MLICLCFVASSGFHIAESHAALADPLRSHDSVRVLRCGNSQLARIQSAVCLASVLATGVRLLKAAVEMEEESGEKEEMKEVESVNSGPRELLGAERAPVLQELQEKEERHEGTTPDQLEAGTGKEKLSVSAGKLAFSKELCAGKRIASSLQFLFNVSP